MNNTSLTLDQKFIIGFVNNPILYNILDYESFLNKYYNYLAGAYIHPPFGQDYDGGKYGIITEYSNDNINNIKQQIKLLQQYNIPIQVTFNSYSIYHNYSVRQLCNDIEKYINIFGIPDYILTYDKFAPIVHTVFPYIKLARTVNENNFININNKNLSYYDIVVFRNNFYNIKLFKELKYRYNTKIEFIAYNRCSSHCPKHCGEPCDLVFKTFVDKFGLNYEIAMQCILPVELKLFNNSLDYIKCCTGSTEMLENQINIYTNNTASNYKFIQNHIQNIYQQHSNSDLGKQFLAEYQYTYNEQMYKEIIQVKNKIWTEQLGYPIDIEQL